MENRAIRIALIGDYDPQVTAHQAIPVALGMLAEQTGREVQFQWLPTEQIHADAALAHFDGFWCVPASPYKSEAGALRAIRLPANNSDLSSAPAAVFSMRCWNFPATCWAGPMPNMAKRHPIRSERCSRR